MFAQAVLSEIEHANVFQNRFLKMASPGRGDCTAIKIQISENGSPGRDVSTARKKLRIGEAAQATNNSDTEFID